MFKKNPVFFSLIGLCFLVFAGSSYLAFSSWSQKSKSDRLLQERSDKLERLLTNEISLIDANVAAADANVEELQKELARISGELSRGSSLMVEEDGVSAIASIQQYISDCQAMANEHTDAEGALSQVIIPDEFAFGFDEFYSEADVPTSVAEVIHLNNQRQILEYLVNILIESSPESIVAVAREPFGENTKQKNISDSLFTVDPAMTTAREGAIETLGFKLVFTGDSNSLRVFLNKLNRFDYPVVVRSVDVERPSGSETTAAPRESNQLEDIFGVFSSNDSSLEEKKAAADELSKPVIQGNTSQFSIVIEYFQIISTSEEEVAEAS